jgi:hypothetical protein
MSLPLNFPIPEYVTQLHLSTSLPLAEFCAFAGVSCKGSGLWRQRKIQAIACTVAFIQAEPGGWGSVCVGVPWAHCQSPQSMARYTLGALAYGLFDVVARESVKGQVWTKIKALGRPRSGHALTSAERQKRYRQRWAKVASPR